MMNFNRDKRGSFGCKLPSVYEVVTVQCSVPLDLETSHGEGLFLISQREKSRRHKFSEVPTVTKYKSWNSHLRFPDSAAWAVFKQNSRTKAQFDTPGECFEPLQEPGNLIFKNEEVCLVRSTCLN